MGRCWLRGVVVGVLVLAGVLALPAVTVARGGSGGRLVVVVSGLAKGVRPMVRVTGPGGFSRLVSRSGERLSGLAPGRYVLEVERTSGQGMMFSAGKHDRVVTHVSAGVKRVVVAYVFGERKGAVGVARGGVLSAKLSHNGGGSLVLTEVAAKGVHPGGYVVVGVSKPTPEGFLGRVTSVKPAKAGKQHGVRVVAAPASLADVLPELDVSLNIPAKSVHVSQSVPPTPARATPLGFGLGARTPFAESGCSGGRHMDVSADANASLGVDVRIVHHLLSLHPELGARLEAHGDESASVTASIDGEATCTLPSTNLGPEITLGEYPIPNPLDLPLIASPVLQFSVSGQAQAQASASASASESAHADAGIQATNRGVHPFASFTHQASYQPPSYTAQASVSGQLTGQITVGINGTGLGPDFALNEELGLSADPHANPCWALTDEVSATAGIDLDHIIDLPDLSVYDHTFPLANSGSCAAPTITTTNPGPQTTPVGTPVNLPITPVDSAGDPTTSTATGLPTGTTIDPTTGTVTGTPTTAGSTNVVVTTVDTASGSTTTTFMWTVTGGQANVWSGTLTAETPVPGAVGATLPPGSTYTITLLGPKPGDSPGPDGDTSYDYSWTWSETANYTYTDPSTGCYTTYHFSGQASGTSVGNPDQSIFISWNSGQWEANGGDYDYYNGWPLMDEFTSTTGGPRDQCGDPSTSSGTEPVDRDFDVFLPGAESATTLNGDTIDTPFSSDGTMHWDLSRNP